MNRTPNSEAPEPPVIAQPEPRRPSGRVILLAGVAGACVMGVGLGLWARPGLHERQAALVARAAPPPAAAPPARQLEIVVDSHPRMSGAPIEVLAPGAAVAAPRFAPTPVMAPSRPPQGLMKTRDEAPPPAAAPHESRLNAVIPQLAAAFAGTRLVLARLEHPAPAEAQPVHEATSAHSAEPLKLAKAQQRALEIARADAAKAATRRAALAKAAFDKSQAAAAEAREARAAQAELARAEAAKARAARAEARRVALAKAEARAGAHRQQLARAQAAKADAAHAAAHKLELARAAKAEKAEQLKLAKAEARAKAAQREEARLEKLAEAAEAKKRTQLARLAHALARAVTGREAQAQVEPARLDRRHGRHEPKVQVASLKSRKRHEPPPRLASAHAGRVRPEPLAPPPGSGLMKVSTTPHCASRDPGEAMTCADPSLSAAERQVSRAYQGARAAGVPDGQLQAGQQRWLAARAAAAREAPWALRDVYMARIAELNGQAKEAQGGY